MSRPTLAETLDGVYAELTDAIAGQDWESVDAVREGVRQLWLDEIARESREATKEVA